MSRHQLFPGQRPGEGLRTRRHAIGALAAGSGMALAAGAGVALAPRPGHAAARHGFGILGQQAPPIAGSFWIDPDGHPTDFAMSEIEGRWVYLKCFQSWCPGCHKHGFPTLKRVSDAFAGDERIAFVAVQTVFEGFSSNTRAKVREVQLRYDLRMKMGHDPGDPNGDHRPATMRRYRTGGTPWVVLIDPGGHIVFNDYHVNADRLTGYLRNQLRG